MNDFEFENLVKGIESCFKQNYCAMSFTDLVMKFLPEISETELGIAVDVMYDRGQIKNDGGLLRLVVK